MKRAPMLVAALALAACHARVAPAPTPAPPPATANATGAAPGQRTLEVTVNGQQAAAWSPERLAQIDKVQLTSRGGENKDGWSLRDLTRALVGKGARVVAVQSEESGRVAIDPAAWANLSGTLILRANNRGEFKIHWVGADGRSGAALAKHIQRIEIAL
jgi:hypothetical protein